MSQPEEEQRKGFWQRYPAGVLVLLIWFVAVPVAVLALVALLALITSLL